MHDIDDSVVPGSVYLVDVQDKAAVVHAGNESAIVLSPTPSSDVNDPLNWSRGRKILHVTCVMICLSRRLTDAEVDTYSLQTRVPSVSGRLCCTPSCSLSPMTRGYHFRRLMLAPDIVSLSLHFFCLYSSLVPKVFLCRSSMLLLMTGWR
jgi:hypothetical protein